MVGGLGSRLIRLQRGHPSQSLSSRVRMYRLLAMKAEDETIAWSGGGLDTRSRKGNDSDRWHGVNRGRGAERSWRGGGGGSGVR
jgi:hypothetical protein